MSKTTIQTNASATASQAGIANDIQVVSGVAITLAATGAVDGMGHTIVVLNNSATDYSGGGKTITFTGTDENDNVITEAIAGPAGSTTSSTTKYFKTVTNAVSNFTRGSTDSFDIGWNAASAGPWFRPYLEGVAPINIGIAVAWTSGTYSLSYTYDGVTWTAPTALSGKGAAAVDVSVLPAKAWRQTYTVFGTTTVTFVQAGPVGN
jgi:hypothetical protein